MPGSALDRGLGGERLAHLALAGEERPRDRRAADRSRSLRPRARRRSSRRAGRRSCRRPRSARARRGTQRRGFVEAPVIGCSQLQPPCAAGAPQRACRPASSPMRASSQARSPSSRVISSAYSAIEMRLATVASASRRASRRVGARQRLDLLVLGVAQQGRGLGLVQHLEARRHAGLEREALEQRLAEGVDGEDVDAARRVEHAREQAARQAALLGLRRRGRSARSISLPSVASSAIAQRPSWPASRLRISAAAALVKVRQRMRSGSHAVEQQARHAVGQHLGLAGAGIGLDPGRVAGRGGAPLRVAGELQARSSTSLIPRLRRRSTIRRPARDARSR